MDLENNPDAQTAQFLCNASKLVSLPVLQCHYLSKCRTLEEQKRTRLPTKLFQPTAMCKFCSNVFSSGRCRVTIVPKKRPGKKFRRTLRKREETPSLLRPFEKKLLEKYEKDKDNKLVIKCLLCKKCTSVPLRKPKTIYDTPDDTTEHVDTPVTRKKKKKKKKDMYAGLNSSVVSAYTPKKERSSLIKQEAADSPMSTPLRKRKKKKKSQQSLSDKLLTKNEGPIKTPKKKSGEKSSHMSSKSTPQSTPRLSIKQQLKLAKAERLERKRKEVLDKQMELKNSAKRAKKCNVLQKMIGQALTPSSKTSLKDFFKSLK